MVPVTYLFVVCLVFFAVQTGADLPVIAETMIKCHTEAAIDEQCEIYDPCTGVHPRPEETQARSCGDNQCMCTESEADCSGIGKKKKYIPRFPKSVESLNFSFNYVPVIDKHFLKNATRLRSLDLTNCSVSEIRTGSFDLFTNLRLLFLDWNRFWHWEKLMPVFMVPALTQLSLLGNFLGPVPEHLFRPGLPIENVWMLCLGGNDMGYVTMNAFMALKDLFLLDISVNALRYRTFHIEDAYLPQIYQLDLTRNNFMAFPKFCTSNRSVFPNLINLVMEYMPNTMFPVTQCEKPCLPNLRYLSILGHIMRTLRRDTFGECMFPLLHTLIVDTYMKGITSVEKFAFRNPTLTKLHLAGTLLDFSWEGVDADCFAGCPNLTSLTLDNSVFTFVSDDKFNRLFSQISGLRFLSLTGCLIDHINRVMLSGLKMLEILWLDFNKLTSIPDGAFDGLDSLTHLRLTYNRIPVVKEPTFSFPLRQRLVVVDLRGNPFFCSCYLRWFQWWIMTDDPADKDFLPGLRYNCENYPDTTVQQFYVADQACLLSPEESKFIIATIGMLLLLCTLLITVYRYRWNLRLLLYEVFRGPEDRLRRQRRLQQPFEFDIFVSYDKTDLPWVRSHLMPQLEEGLGLKLCVHERDFIIGKHIVDNIADCVRESKKVMMLFSSNFAKSQWCQFELALCLSHVMEHDDSLLIVLLHDIPSRYMTSAMMAVMKTTTYIEWGDQPEARDSFWKRMYIALNELLPDARV